MTQPSHTSAYPVGQPGTASVPRPRGPVLYAPPPPGYAAPPPTSYDDRRGVEVPGSDRVAVSVRNQVIDRMVRMNRSHASLAWDNRRSQPISPHGIAFLYADPAPRSGRGLAPPEQPGHHGDALFYTVVAATRIVQDADDIRDLPDLVYRLTKLARDRYLPTSGGFDPATQMAIHRDDASGHAPYVGLGVSTLDTPAGTWVQAQRTARDFDDIPGRCFALLFDHTAALIDRGAPRHARNDIGVHCTGELNNDGMAMRMWTRHPDVSTMPAAREVWDLMHELHQLIYHQTPRPTL